MGQVDSLRVGVEAASTNNGTSSSQIYGLEWPGDGSVRRMLYWSDPFPIYDATYIFNVYPRKKVVPANSPTGYYTTFFWGNNGNFTWDGGNCNAYYGAHPYPIPAPNGPGQWEISINCGDLVTGMEVEWDRWYTQVFRVWRESPSITHHEFYYDWPDTNKVLTYTIDDPNWASTNPPAPAIVMGQAPDICGPPPGDCGASWGGYQGWEEFNGIIRGIQIYSTKLPLGDIQAEIAAPKSTIAGQSSIWYLNLDPRPSDVTDKKGIGAPNNPTWDGSTASEWSNQVPSSDTSPPDTTITAAPSNPSNSSTASFSFTSTEAGSTFQCQIDGSGFSICTSPKAYSFLGAGTHTFDVKAMDASGNSDPTPATFSWTIDNTAPMIVINSGPTSQAGGSTKNTSAVFNFISSDPTATFSCSLDNATFAPCTSPKTYVRLKAGTHSFRVQANVSAPADLSPVSFSWVIDNKPPNTIITSGPPLLTNNPAATFTFTSNEPGTFECSLDGSAFVPCDSPFVSEPLPDGKHAFQVRAVDSAENVDRSAARAKSWAVDTIPPVTIITSKPADPTTSPNTVFKFAAEKGSTFQCSLDGAPFTACMSGQKYSGLTKGTHKFQVQARDKAGNLELIPVTFGWRIN